MKRLFVTEAAQQGVVNWTMLLADLGLAMVLVALAAFLLWRLYDLFVKDGFWTKELSETRKREAMADLEEQKRKMEEITAVLEESAS